jgi:hypothetical protein
MKKLRILYAGDSEGGGPARYLLGVMKTMNATVAHVPPSRSLTPASLRARPDLVILSDMPAARVPATTQKAIARHLEDGVGLLMVGGWGSFSGPFGGWRNTLIESLLPVRCLSRDDRTNFPGGALLLPAGDHPSIAGVPFDPPAAICGVNRVLPRPGARVVLNAHRLEHRLLPTGARIHTLDPAALPLLVVDADPDRRVAAFTSDFAPHWAGGLVDWGPRTEKIRLKAPVEIEVGAIYILFIKTLLGWLGRRK